MMTIDPMAPSNAIAVSETTEKKIAARWIEVQGMLRADRVPSDIFPAYYSTHRRRCLAAIVSGLEMRTLRRTTLDDPRIDDTTFQHYLATYLTKRQRRKVSDANV